LSFGQKVNPKAIRLGFSKSMNSGVSRNTIIEGVLRCWTMEAFSDMNVEKKTSKRTLAAIKDFTYPSASSCSRTLLAFDKYDISSPITVAIIIDKSTDHKGSAQRPTY
jgi:hypothetical protein